MTLRAGTPTAAALQLTWLDGDIMAWQPGRGAYGGNLNAAVSRALGPAVGSAVGSLRVARLLLPDGPASVMCQRIDPAALVALARSGALDGAPGPSVAWFTAAAQLADHLVREGRIIPVVDDLGDGWQQARWHPLRGGPPDRARQRPRPAHRPRRSRAGSAACGYRGRVPPGGQRATNCAACR